MTDKIILKMDKYKDLIISMYWNGSSLRKIEEETCFWRNSITKYLKLNNVEIDSKKRSTKYDFNSNFFDVIDSEEKAYWLGFLAADGYITKNNILGCCIQSRDANHLRKFLKWIEYTGDLYEINPYTKVYDATTINSHGSVRIHLRNMANVMIEKHNFCLNKSNNYAFPQYIDKNLIHHFIRGYFDGDGSVFKVKNSDLICVSILGTFDVIWNMKSMFWSSIIRKEKRCENVFVLWFSSFKCKDLYDYMYSDASIFLERKKEIFDNGRYEKNKKVQRA